MVDAAAGSGLFKIPGLTAPLPGRRVKVVGVTRVANQVHHAGRIIDEQGLLPEFAAVGGFKNAPFGIVAVQVTEGGNPNRTGVFLVHNNPPDVVGFGQADKGPGITPISRPVNAVARVRAAAGVDLARAYVDRFGDPVHVDITDGHHR